MENSHQNFVLTFKYCIVLSMTLFPKENGDDALALRICMHEDTIVCHHLLLKMGVCRIYLLKWQ